MNPINRSYIYLLFPMILTTADIFKIHNFRSCFCVRSCNNVQKATHISTQIGSRWPINNGNKYAQMPNFQLLCDFSVYIGIYELPTFPGIYLTSSHGCNAGNTCNYRLQRCAMPVSCTLHCQTSSREREVGRGHILVLHLISLHPHNVIYTSASKPCSYLINGL